MKFAATVLAAALLAVVSAEASLIKGEQSGTNAQRFARGLPPKAVRPHDLRNRRALRARASAVSDPHSVITPGSSCGCTYNVYQDTAATYDDPVDQLVASGAADNLAGCETMCDSYALCLSATFDPTTGTCTVWNAMAASLSNAEGLGYIAYNDGYGCNANNCEFK